MKHIVILLILALVSGCAGIPMPQTEVVTINGTEQTVRVWKSQTTMIQEQKLDFIRLMANNADAKEPPQIHIPPPTGNNAAGEQEYYRTIQLQLALKGGSSLDYKTVQAIQGKPTSDAARMFEESEKTARHKQELRSDNISRWFQGAVGLLDIGERIYARQNPSASDIGSGVYVAGDVVTSQTMSNSGDKSGGAGGEAGAGGAGSSAPEERIGAQNVFGSNVTSIARDQGRLSATGRGSTQQLETSANGFTSTSSTLKGIDNADEKNAPSTFDDQDFSPSLDF